jgi:hypothetical protein
VTFVWFNHPDYRPEQKAFEERNAQRLHEERGWTIRTLDSDHVAERSHPRELAKLLEESVGDTNTPAAAR